MRVRVVLGVGLLAITALLALEMSGSALRTAGSNHVSAPVFAAVVPGNGLLCEPDKAPPPGAASAQLLIGTYGHPMPALELQFQASSGAVVSSGHSPAGGPQGLVAIPLSRPRAEAVRSCLRVGGKYPVAVGGEAPASPVGTVVNGTAQAGRISLLYHRRHAESWWQLLPTLSTRFGLGKAPLFGSWTLLAVALLTLGLWTATVRLLLRELR